MHRRVRAAASLCFFSLWRRRLGSYYSQLFSWVSAEEAPERHARDGDGDAATEVWGFSSSVWVDRSVLVALGRPSWREKLGIRPPSCFFEEPPPGYAVLWSVAVGAAVAPLATLRSSRLIGLVVVIGIAQRTMGCPGGAGWPSENLPCKT